jgi:hypothetical protein
MPYKDISEKRRKDREYWLKVKNDGPPAVASAMNRAIDIVRPLDIVVPKHGLRVAYIPDVQATPGVRMEHVGWAGQYIAAKRPDVVVCAGDFGDFHSLSRFGRGERKFEGRRYMNDLAAYHYAMQLLLDPIQAAAGYKPRMVYNMGNHEDHINRKTQEDPTLAGLISTDDLCLEEYGWEVYDFLQPVSVAGVAFSHYFPSGVMGRSITSAPELLRKLHMSAVAGHQQGREIGYGRRADGSQMTAIISGSFYQHDMEYLSPFTNAHWRGMWMFHEMHDGQFDEMAVSINFLKRKFG